MSLKDVQAAKQETRSAAGRLATRRTARRGSGRRACANAERWEEGMFGKPRRRRFFFSGLMAENVPFATVCHARELRPSHRLPLLQSAAHLHLSVSSTGDGHGLCVVVFVCFCMFLFLPYQHFMNPVSCFIWRRFQLDQPCTCNRQLFNALPPFFFFFKSLDKKYINLSVLLTTLVFLRFARHNLSLI